MNNPKYSVAISHVPMSVNGQTSTSIDGVTYSIPTWSYEYFVASMPEINISATGSSHIEALANLMIIATASTTVDNGHTPYSDIRTW